MNAPTGKIEAAPGAAEVQAWMAANGVREVRQRPLFWEVLLTCGGPSGIGDTVSEALERARDANAEWLDEAA